MALQAVPIFCPKHGNVTLLNHQKFSETFTGCGQKVEDRTASLPNPDTFDGFIEVHGICGLPISYDESVTKKWAVDHPEYMY